MSTKRLWREKLDWLPSQGRAPTIVNPPRDKREGAVSRFRTEVVSCGVATIRNMTWVGSDRSRSVGISAGVTRYACV